MSCGEGYLVLGDGVGDCEQVSTASVAAELQQGGPQLLNGNEMCSSLEHRFQTKSNLFAQF